MSKCSLTRYGLSVRIITSPAFKLDAAANPFPAAGYFTMCEKLTAMLCLICEYENSYAKVLFGGSVAEDVAGEVVHFPLFGSKLLLFPPSTYSV